MVDIGSVLCLPTRLLLLLNTYLCDFVCTVAMIKWNLKNVAMLWTVTVTRLDLKYNSNCILGSRKKAEHAEKVCVLPLRNCGILPRGRCVRNRREGGKEGQKPCHPPLPIFCS